MLLRFFIAAMLLSQAATAQLLPDSVRNYWSLAFNVKHLMPYYQPYEPALVAYGQYRFGQNAIRLGFATANYYYDGSQQGVPPSAYRFADSTLSIEYDYASRYGGGLTLDYLRHFQLAASSSVELYAGAGLFVGTLTAIRGTWTRYYRMDSMGTFRVATDSFANAWHPAFQQNALALGAVPIVGMQLWPRNVLSVGAEMRFPIIYQQFRNNTTLVGSEMQFTINAIVNFHFRKGRRTTTD